MADANIWQRPNGKWEVRWRTRDGRRKSRTFGSESAAQEFRVGISSEQLRLSGGALPDLTVASFIEEKWWPGVRVRVAESTKARWENEVRNHITPRLGTLRLRDVRVEDIDNLNIARAEQGASHESILKMRSVLSNIWTEANRLGYTDKNPVRLSRLPTRKRSRVDETVFALDQVQRIAEAAATIWPGYAGPILIAAGAGLRWGEVAALTSADIDLASGAVRVNKSLSEVAGRFEIKGPKSRAGNRVAVFHASIKDGLVEHLANHTTAELMFPSPGGYYLRRSNFARRVFKRSVAAAGLESDNTFHSLRKTYATMLAELGAAPRSISDLLGHAQVSTTLDLYASRFDGEVHRMAELLGHPRLRVVGS